MRHLHKRVKELGWEENSFRSYLMEMPGEARTERGPGVQAHLPLHLLSSTWGEAVLPETVTTPLS